MRLAVLGLIAPVLLGVLRDLRRFSAAPGRAAGRDDHASTPRAGRKAFTVEVAADAASQERGLMFRRDMARDAGMLFDFHQEARVSFWMKNTPLPLDMLFIRADGTVSSVEPNAVPFSTDLDPLRRAGARRAGDQWRPRPRSGHQARRQGPRRDLPRRRGLRRRLAGPEAMGYLTAVRSGA